MFRHPKYYKELRKLRNKSEQAISARETADDARAPGPGHKLQAREDSTANSTRGRVAEPQASSNKQGSSNKPQATKSQAAGDKAQAPSSEGQASSHKHRDPL